MRYGKKSPLLVCVGLLVSSCSAVWADNAVSVSTSARNGAHVSTSVTATGNNILNVVNHGSHGARSHLRLDATGRKGGLVRSDISQFNVGGVVLTDLKHKAVGRGASIDAQEVIVSHYGQVDKRERLSASGNSQIRWRTQDVAVDGGRIEARKDVRLNSRGPSSASRLTAEIIDDADRHEVRNRMKMKIDSVNGGVNDHSVFNVNSAHGDSVRSILRTIQHSDSGHNQSTLGLFNHR